MPTIGTGRAVEVLHDRGPAASVGVDRWTAGSGYLIGARLVLTAAHNVDFRQQLSDQEKLLVRTIAGVELTAWPMLVCDEASQVDLALLEIRDPRFDESLASAGFARVDRDSPVPVSDCWAVGFPRFGEARPVLPEGSRRETWQVSGEILPGAKLRSGLLSLQVTITPRPLPAQLAGSEWEGMSGAVVFAADPVDGDRALGVVSMHHPPEGESALTVVPITAVGTLPGAKRWWDALGVPEPDALPVVARHRSPAAGQQRSRLSGERALREHWDPRGRGTPANIFLVDRPEYLDRLQALINDGHQLICVWGEPGTGKSTLAEQLAPRLGCDGTVLVIHCAPLLTAVTTETERFQKDLDTALVAEGVDPATEVPERRFSRLCEQIAGQPRSSAIVLDNLETDWMIKQVVQARPKIPVIMTMRERPDIPAIACEEVADFTASQAHDFIKRHLPAEKSEDIEALAHVLGCRPLALEHAVGFVQAVPDLQRLVHALATEAAAWVSHLTPVRQRPRSLTRLYELVVASLEEHDYARAVLDSFLAVVGDGGTGDREVLFLFMQSEQGGAHGRFHVEVGLRDLLQLGLVRQEVDLVRLSPDAGDDERRERYLLSMHALTYRILRDLRGLGPLAIESRYWDFVLQGGHQALPADERSVLAHAQLSAAQRALGAAIGCLPPGWAAFSVMDERTWIVLMEADGDTTPAARYVVRYAVHPNAYYKLDNRTGRRSSVAGDEARMFTLVLTIYFERVMPVLLGQTAGQVQGVLDGLALSAPARLDDSVTPADDYRHVVIDPLALASCRDLGWSVWALCGKRFVPAAEEITTAVCPECQGLLHSPARLRDIEDALRRHFFATQLDYKEPWTATRLFLVRATLRRQLERFEEAQADLDVAYKFLTLLADQADEDVLALGEGLIHEAALLPQPPEGLIFAAYDHLERRFGGTSQAAGPELARLHLGMARLLEQRGQTPRALIAYQAIVEGLDAGQLDASGITVSQVLLEKGQAERKLGRTDEANASLRRAIAAAEAESGEGRVLANLRQARADLRRFLRIARSEQPPNYESIWLCLRQLGDVDLALGSTALALETLEAALKIANEYLPQRRQETEQAIARMKR